MFERFNIPTGLVFEYPTPNLSNIQLQTYIYWSLVGGYAGGYAGGSAPQRRVHRITSSVHSYLRSISTAGVTGGRRGSAGGMAIPFHTFDLSCSRDLRSNASNTRFSFTIFSRTSIFQTYIFMVLMDRMVLMHSCHRMSLPLSSLFTLRRSILTAMTRPSTLFS
jgi:hypothetical protein